MSGLTVNEGPTGLLDAQQRQRHDAPRPAMHRECSTEPHPSMVGQSAANMHPIIAAAYHNRTNSSLGSLPDNVLVQVMRHLDAAAVECLRRSSRTFLRLFPVAYAEFFCMEDGHPWPISRLLDDGETKAQFLAIIERDWYCQGCLAARSQSDWEERLYALTKVYLHCSGCGVDHPTCLFSAQQRQQPQFRRICIGHEGSIRFCRHKTISWSLVRSAVMSDEFLGRSLPSRTFCFSLDNCASLKHFPRHSSWAPWSFLTPYISWLFNLRCENPELKPEVYLTGRYGSTYFNLGRSWRVHMPMTPTREGEGLYRTQELSDTLEQLWRQGSRFICPKLEAGPLPGAKLFDPGCCDCLKYEGMKETAWARPPSDWRALQTCRTDPTHCRKNMRVPSKLRPLWAEQQCYTDVSQALDATAAGDTESLGGQDLDIRNRISVQICSQTKNCMVLSYNSWFSLDANSNGHLENMGPRWYRQLDPTTYNPVGDKEGLGVYWCSTEGCRNFYGYNQSWHTRLLKPSDFRHACPH